MTKPVNTVPPLPYPGGRDDNRSLAAFDQDMVKALQIYLGELARRANLGLSTDGTETMAGDLNMGFNDIINAISLTILRSASITTQGLTVGPSDASGHFIRGFSSPTNAKNIIYNATTDDANTVPSSGSNRHLFQIRGVEKFTIDDDGSASVASGWLKFPATQVPSSNANTLDDYEEGTWTPALTFGGASTGITYLSQDGSYVKIGQLVHIFLRIRLSSKGTSIGTANITGAPFIANNDIANGVYETGIAAYYTGMAGMASHPAGYINRGASTIVLTHAGATARANMTEANFTDATDMLMSITYRADA